MAFRKCPACNEIISGETLRCPKCTGETDEKRSGKPRRSSKKRREDSTEPAEKEHRDGNERRDPDERRKYSY